MVMVFHLEWLAIPSGRSRSRLAWYERYTQGMSW